MKGTRRSWAALGMSCVLVACGGADATTTLPEGPAVDAVAGISELAGGACSGAFVTHDLDHVTSNFGAAASTFDGLGTGVSIGDLDGDGDLDIVAANLNGDTTIHYNGGDLGFQTEPLIEGRFRAVSIADVDGDGDNDITLSTGIGPPSRFDNLGDRQFDRIRLVGVDAATYSLGWGDLGGDGDLDLVTGSYNAELSIMRNSPVVGSDTGVVVHDSQPDGTYTKTRIAAEAQALAMLLTDIDGDFQTDIVAGNDFSTPDGMWVDNDGGWLPVTPLERTAFSTMSLDSADIDNDGDLDLFASDMKPRPDDTKAEVRYELVNESMAMAPRPDEIQQPENVLSLGGDEFTSVGPAFGGDATGWSWSGVFGDLDSDGMQDLYVATGMRSDSLFPNLPDFTLVEPNQAFAGGDGGMERRPEWGLEDTDGGRGMAFGDLDGDGDLDIVVNNLNAPLRVWENQLCGGSNVLVDLEWSGTRNPAGVGSTIVVTAGERTLTRRIDLSRGYLSSGPTTAHFGLGDHEGDVTIEVLWPDGSRSESTAAPNQHLTLRR